MRHLELWGCEMCSTAFEDAEDHKSRASFEARTRESQAKLAQDQLDDARRRASAALAEKDADVANQVRCDARTQGVPRSQVQGPSTLLWRSERDKSIYV